MSNSININTSKIPTIHQLRRAGWKVRVMHGRMEDYPDLYSDEVGQPVRHLADRVTIIELTSPEGKDAYGVALCSKQDNYNRKLGNRIALGRALKNHIVWNCNQPI
jgi:hypothetical protein